MPDPLPSVLLSDDRSTINIKKIKQLKVLMSDEIRLPLADTISSGAQPEWMME